MSRSVAPAAPAPPELRAEIDRLRRALRERDALLHGIVDGIEVGVVATDSRGVVTLVNRRALETLARPGPVVGEDVRDILALHAPSDADLSTLPERRRDHPVSVGGQDIEIDLTVRRAADPGAADLGFVFLFRDRSAELEQDVERRRFQHLAAMGTMVAGFAHEVRNPMASLRSIAEALQDELAEANLDLPHVARMLNVLERVERLVRTSLLFGRPAPPRRAPHRPWTILSSSLSAIYPRIRALGGELSIDAEVDLPDVFVDDGQLVQALVILLDNAIDAAESPSRVHLRARHARPSTEPRAGKSDPPMPALIRFDVADDGPGIRPDIIARIFDPFFTTKASGTGLGLSIAQQLVTENGGRVEVVSAAGGPTTFTLLVPIATTENAPLSAR